MCTLSSKSWLSLAFIEYLLCIKDYNRHPLGKLHGKADKSAI